MPTLVPRLIGSTGASNSLVEFDLMALTLTEVRSGTVDYNDLAAAPGGVFFGSDVDDIYSIDPQTLDPTLECTSLIGGAESFASLEMVGDDLYAARTSLYLIDVDACSVTTIGPVTGGVTIFDIAYDEVNDILYGCDFTNLFTCDLVTGACTSIGALPYRCAGLAFTPDMSTLYGSGFDGLFEIDIGNPGASTLLISAAPFSVINGLAFVN